MEVKAFKCDNRLTTYKINISEKNIMLDFGSSDIEEKDIVDLDYIFISHEHRDHWGGLDIQKINWIKKHHCKIFATTTTKALIKELVNQDYTYKDQGEKKAIMEVLNAITCLYYYEPYVLDDKITVTLYPSGHTFGSSMIYLSSDELKLLYTGDMDYINISTKMNKQNSKETRLRKERQFACPSDLPLDVVIVDGTNLFDEREFKQDYVNIVVDYIERNLGKNNKRNPKYKIRPEKAVFIARILLIKFLENEKLNDYHIIYENDLEKFLKIICEQGYNPFEASKIYLRHNNSRSNVSLPTDKYVSLTTTGNENPFPADSLLGLHISRNDFINILLPFFESKPKVFISHYDEEKLDETFCNSYGLRILKQGVHRYE